LVADGPPDHDNLHVIRGLEAGERWQNELSKILEECDFGIACLTPKHLHADWITLRVRGAGERVDRSRVIPVLCNLSERDMRNIRSPCSTTSSWQAGVQKIVETINANVTEHQLTKDNSGRSLKVVPDFEEHLKRSRRRPTCSRRKRSTWSQR